MKIEILTTETRERTTKTGKTLRLQTGYLHTGTTPYPRQFQFILWESPPYEKGFYYLADEAFGISRYGDLEIRSMKLVSVPKIGETK